MLYEATLFTSYYGQQCLNRWNYVMTGTPAVVTGSFALASAMGAIPVPVVGGFPEDTVLRAIADGVSNQVQFLAFSVKNVYSVTDFYELPYVPIINGLQSGGEGMSPAMAYGFRTNRVRTDIRRGMKRIEGPIEPHVGPGGVLTEGGATITNTIAAAMSEVLSYTDEGNELTFAPSVVKKQPYTPEGSTQESYRYYPTEEQQMLNVAIGVLWQPYNTIRTQGSRQYGHGQ